MISIHSSTANGSLQHEAHTRNPRQALQAGGSPSAPPCPSPEAITGRSYISWSQVSSYQLCPKAFEFKYVLRADPAFVPSSLIFGTNAESKYDLALKKIGIDPAMLSSAAGHA